MALCILLASEWPSLKDRSIFVNSTLREPGALRRLVHYHHRLPSSVNPTDFVPQSAPFASPRLCLLRLPWHIFTPNLNLITDAGINQPYSKTSSLVEPMGLVFVAFGIPVRWRTADRGEQSKKPNHSVVAVQGEEDGEHLCQQFHVECCGAGIRE